MHYTNHDILRQKEDGNDMAVMDEFKEERERIKKYGTRQEKLAYFWDYYKWHTIIAVIAIIVIGSSIYSSLTAKDIVLNGILLNSYSAVDEEVPSTLISDFLTEQQIDTTKNDITLNTSLYYTTDEEKNSDYNMSELTYTASQIIVVQVAAGELDFMTGDLETLSSLAYSEYFVDLSTVLSEDQLALYEPYLLYIDQTVLEALNEDTDLDSTKTITIPDCDKPETMEKPIPVMINISHCDDVKEFYPHMTEDDPIVFGFTVNSKHAEMTAAFLDFLMK